MATQLPNGKQQFIDANGAPLALGQVFMYVPNTTTAKDTWQDAAQQVLNTNPIDLDSGGYAVIFGNGAYRQVVYDADGNLIWDQLTYGTLDQVVVFGGQIVGTPNALIINPEAPVGALVDGLIIEAYATQDNTGATTLIVSGIGPYPVENNNAALSANSILTGNNYGFAWDATNEVFHLLPWERALIPSGSVGPAELAAAAVGVPINCTLAASVAASALTVALKTLAGTDPTALNPVKVPVMNNSGGYDVLSITSALSLTVSSGSTLGMSDTVLAPLWVVLFNDDGTPRLGIVNTVMSAEQIFMLSPAQSYSATAEGGAGGADSSGVIYAEAAVTNKNIAILGRMEITEATAGTWATAPSKINLMRPWLKLPGDRYAPREINITVPYATGTASFTDVAGLSVSYTLISNCNKVLVATNGICSSGSGVGVFLRLARGGTGILIGSAAGSRIQATTGVANISSNSLDMPFSYSGIDTPNAASATYSLQLMTTSAGNNAVVGSTNTDTNSASFLRTPTNLLIQEIAT